MVRVRGVSVRRESEFLKVLLFCDGVITFKGQAPINDPDKIRGLLVTLRSKGVSFPKDDSWW